MSNMTSTILPSQIEHNGSKKDIKKSEQFRKDNALTLDFQSPLQSKKPPSSLQSIFRKSKKQELTSATFEINRKPQTFGINDSNQQILEQVHGQSILDLSQDKKTKLIAIEQKYQINNKGQLLGQMLETHVDHRGETMISTIINKYQYCHQTQEVKKIACQNDQIRNHQKKIVDQPKYQAYGLFGESKHFGGLQIIPQIFNKAQQNHYLATKQQQQDVIGSCDSSRILDYNQQNNKANGKQLNLKKQQFQMTKSTINKSKKDKADTINQNKQKFIVNTQPEILQNYPDSDIVTNKVQKPQQYIDEQIYRAIQNKNLGNSSRPINLTNYQQLHAFVNSQNFPQTSNQNKQNNQTFYYNAPDTSYRNQNLGSVQFIPQPKFNNQPNMYQTDFNSLPIYQNSFNAPSLSPQSIYSQNMQQTAFNNLNGLMPTNSYHIPYNAQNLSFTQNHPFNTQGIQNIPFIQSTPLITHAVPINTSTSTQYTNLTRNYNHQQQCEYKGQLNSLVDEINNLRKSLQQKDEQILEYKLKQLVRKTIEVQQSKIKQYKSTYGTKKSIQQTLDSPPTNFTRIKRHHSLNEEQTDKQYERLMNELEIEYINKFFKLKKEYLRQKQAALDRLEDKMISQKLKQPNQKSQSMKSKNNGISSEQQSPKYYRLKSQSPQVDSDLMNSGANSAKFAKGNRLVEETINDIKANNGFKFQPVYRKKVGQTIKSLNKDRNENRSQR